MSQLISASALCSRLNKSFSKIRITITNQTTNFLSPSLLLFLLDPVSRKDKNRNRDTQHLKILTNKSATIGNYVPTNPQQQETTYQQIRNNRKLRTNKKTSKANVGFFYNDIGTFLSRIYIGFNAYSDPDLRLCKPKN